MKKILLILFIVVLSLLVICLSLVFIVINTEELSMDLGIAKDHIGFNIDTDAVHFGTLYKGGTSTRYLIFNNTHNKDIKVIVKSFGELSDWVYVEKNKFILKRGEEEIVKIRVIPPEEAEYGYYNGTLKIFYTKVF